MFNQILQKMKMNKFFVALLATSFALASCSMEDGASSKKGDGKDTYAGVSISIPVGFLTKAEDPTAGISGEKTITTIGVYIVDQNNFRLDYMVLTSAQFTGPVTDANNRSVYTATAAVPTVTGNKKVYVVANPNVAMQTKLASSGSTFMNAIPFGMAETNFLNTSGTTLNSMVISGAYTATGGILDMTTVMTAADAVQTANLVPITIQRNLSKAVVQQGSSYAVIGGTTTLTWAPMNNANDAYLLPQSAGTLYSTIPGGAESNASHAYWNNFSTPVAGDFIPVLAYGGSDAKTAAYDQSKYMFENMPTTFHQGNTTAVRIKGIFVPANTYTGITAGVPSPATGTITSGQDFYRSKIDGSYWTQAGRDAAITAGYNSHSAVADFTYYQGGVGYYTIWVNDGAGNKGVKRNGYYLMQINEVRGPGIPDPIVPPLPPVEDDTNLGVVITVLNWDYMKSEQNIQ